MFDFKIIQNKVKRLQTTKVLHAYLTKDMIFPLQFKLPKINAHNLSLNFTKFQAMFLKLQNSADKYGFSIEYSKQYYRILGTQKTPSYIIFNGLDSWLKTTEYNFIYHTFCQICDYVMSHLPLAKDYLFNNLKSILDYSLEDWHKIIQVCKYLIQNPCSNVYLRQLDIIDVDTKFIETHKKIIHELVQANNSNNKIPIPIISLANGVFEQIYGIRNHNISIRFRLLDKSLSHNFCNNSWLQYITDFSVPLHEFALLNIPCEKIFISENKISGISFPELSNSIIIFGLGYGIEVLKHIEWLKNKEIIYWGDIDTHGFAILSQMRGYFPQTQSIMMDANTLENFKDLCTHELRQTNAQLINLTPTEHELYSKLLNNYYGENIRLEQERIKLKYVENFLYGFTSPTLLN